MWHVQLSARSCATVKHSDTYERSLIHIAKESITMPDIVGNKAIKFALVDQGPKP